MSTHEEFAVALNGASVGATLQRPEPSDRDQPLAAVLLCHGLGALTAQTAELFDQITDALVEAGLAVATIGKNATDSCPLPGGVGSVDAASAVFRWMALRDELDLNRIGVLGYSLGGIIAACLSRRTDQIARLCLLAPMTVDQVTEKQAGETTHEPAGQLLGDLASLTPIEDLVVHDRPTLIMHGAADRIVGPEASLAYRRAVELARHKVEHLLVAQADHLFSGAAARSACLDQLTRFFAPMSESPGDAGRP